MELAALAPRATEYVAALRERLPEKTLRHTLSVTELMRELVTNDGALAKLMTKSEQRDAVTAALLHDYCKALKPAELIERASTYRYEPTPSQREKPSLLHGPVAAFECRELYAIGDDAFDAIFWHTTGKPELGIVGRALYFCDFAEPLRSHPESDTARETLARDGFEKALLYVARKKHEHVITKSVADPMTEAFRAWLEANPLAHA